MIWSGIKLIAEPIVTLVQGWQKRKTAKTENELALAKAVTEAKIRRAGDALTGDLKWENTALVNAGIKDEVMMFVILFPMVLCFIPGLAPYVKQGFEIMNESLPAYWEYAFYATIGVSYGLKKWTDIKSIMRGN